MESIIAFFTLVHAAVYHTTKLQTKTTPTRAILNALYMDGFAYYVVCVTRLSPFIGTHFCKDDHLSETGNLPSGEVNLFLIF